MTVGAVLKKSLARAKRQNPSFSLRQLAVKMHLSSAFLSKVFNDKTPLPTDRVDEIVRHLKIDKLGTQNLKQALVRSRLKGSDFKLNESVPTEAVRDYTEAANKDLSLLRYWYYSAILNLTTCQEFQNEPSWIAQRLCITENEAQRALLFLKTNGYLIEREGLVQVCDRLIRFSTRSSHPEIRNLNLQVLKKAATELQTKQTQVDFDSRLITTLSVAVNPQNIPQAINKLHACLFEIANTLTEGACSEVYQLSAQLFPTTVQIAHAVEGNEEST